MGDKLIPKYIKKHENYDPYTNENDLALIKTRPIIFNSTIIYNKQKKKLKKNYL